MSDPQARQLRNQCEAAILASMKKAPKGIRGTRGNLVHLQDPKFVTNDAELLMTRPTRKLTPLINSVADRNGVSRPLVKKLIGELESKSILSVTSERKPKGIPRLIPIRREKEYHTDKIGSFAHGQFAGFVFYLKAAQQRRVSVLHVFDKFGFHQHSEAWDSREGSDPENQLNYAISGLVQSHPTDIQIQLFEIELLGTSFGLIQTSADHVEYVPYGLGFAPPWDGQYDT